MVYAKQMLIRLAAFLLVTLLATFGSLGFMGCSQPAQQETKAEEQTQEQAEQQEEAAEEKADEPDLSEWMFYDSDSRYLDDDDLSGLSDWELKVARNEIFARHGRGFSSEDLKEYFESKSWYEEKYSPDEFDSKHSDELNKYEKKNVEFIADYEGPKYDYFDESGDYYGIPSGISKISISGDTMMIKGGFTSEGGSSLKSATRYFKLSSNCEYDYDWGGGGGKQDVIRELENLEFETMAFEIRGGEVVYLRTGA